MKHASFLAVLAVLICIMASAAMALPAYVVTKTASGSEWIYSLQNNTSNQYVASWVLYWADPLNQPADNALATASFDEDNGYKAFPSTKWDPDYTYSNHPGFVTGSSTSDDRVGPGQTKTGFRVSFISPYLPNFFMVTYVDQTGQATPQAAYGTAPGTAAPEPGGLMTLFGGLASGMLGFRLRRRN
jgi:hypothetical protein